MSHLIGFAGITLVLLITAIFSLRWPKVSRILYVGLLIRIIFIILDNYFIALPDSSHDADTFETLAWNWSKGGFFNVFNYYTGPNYNFISWILAILYSLIGERSVMLTQSVSLFFGIGTIFLGWLLANKIWDEKIALKVGWCIALFPSLILYSCLTLREIYISFFLLVALFGAVSWSKDNNIKSIVIAFIGFTAVTFFHSAMIVGGITFFSLVLFENLKKSFRALYNLRINIISIIILISFIILFIFYNAGLINLDLDYFNKKIDVEKIIREIHNRQGGDGAYPEWTKPDTAFELFYKAPLRIIYFLFSPFPWDVSKFSHIIGLFDSIFYIWLFCLIIFNLKEIFLNPQIRIIFYILMSFLLVFGIVIGNFGTSIRHKTKFVVAIILLAGPKLPFFIFKKNNRLKNLINNKYK